MTTASRIWCSRITDVWVDFLRGTPQAFAFVSKLHNDVAINSISVAELYAGVRDGAEIQA